jgi:hypothetical protein
MVATGHGDRGPPGEDAMRQRGFTSIIAALIATLAAGPAAAGGPASPPRVESDAEMVRHLQETDRPNAPVDYGYGPGVRPPTRAAPLASATAPLATAPLATAPLAAEGVLPAPVLPIPVPEGGPAAAAGGVFGPVIPWPIIPIHAVLLPDARVLSFGALESGRQGGYVTSVWDTARGTHITLPNGTPTDLFCAGQTVLGDSGQVFIAGGDLTVRGVRNFSTADVNLFDPATQTLSLIQPMFVPRWYPTVVPLPTGELLVLGGRSTREPITGVPTPEVYNPASGWRLLSNASSNAAYGRTGWYYPRAFQAPNGLVFVFVRTGELYYLDPAGSGRLTRIPGPLAPVSGAGLPAIMYAPGQILSLRYERKVVTFDINRSPPVMEAAADIDAVRYWASGTILADGKVLVNGGSAVSNRDIGVSYTAQIWDPATRLWTTGATARRMRLYHSITLLLPDGTVLTAGGGAPGPVRNLNAEIYFPPYLYRSDGEPATRPVIGTAPDRIRLGQAFTAEMATSEPVRRVTLVRPGSDTHTVNVDHRFFDLPFTQDDRTLTLTAPADPNLALSGWYLLFAFNGAGTPSVAKIIRLRA